MRRFLISILIINVAATSIAHAKPRALRSGIELYYRGDFAGAAAELSKAAGRLESSHNKALAHKFLAYASYHLLREERAAHHFHLALSLKPSMRPKMRQVGTRAAVRFFQARLFAYQQSAYEQSKFRQPTTPPLRPQLIAARDPAIEDLHRAQADPYVPELNLLPLGAGQFQHGDTLLGTFFLVTEGASLAFATTSLIEEWQLSKRRDDKGNSEGRPPDRKLQERIDQSGKNGRLGLTVFAGLYVLGVIEGIATYRARRQAAVRHHNDGRIRLDLIHQIGASPGVQFGWQQPLSLPN